MPTYTRTPQRLKLLEHRVAFAVDSGIVTSKANELIERFENAFNVDSMTQQQRQRFERIVTHKLAMQGRRNGTLTKAQTRAALRNSVTTHNDTASDLSYEALKNFYAKARKRKSKEGTAQ